MTAGLSIVNTHNVWALDWSLIVTLLGWALFLGGAVRIALSRVVDRVGGAMMDRDDEDCRRILGCAGWVPDLQGLCVWPAVTDV